MVIRMPLMDEEALTMAENLIALLEAGDALAAAVERWAEGDEWTEIQVAARVWRAARAD